MTSEPRAPRSPVEQVRAFVGLAALSLATACGGSVPLVHSAHALARGDMSVAAGFSGALLETTLADGDSADVELVEESAVAPGLAPVVSARVGLGSSFEAGLAYTGRAVRVDGRRAFDLGRRFSLSVGLAGSGVISVRDSASGARVGGFGGDVPLVVGWRSSAGVYELWLGARVGVDRLEGERVLPVDPLVPDIVRSDGIVGEHESLGGLIGVQVGLGRLAAVLELDGAAHFARFDVGANKLTFRGLSIAPAAALVGRF